MGASCFELPTKPAVRGLEFHRRLVGLGRSRKMREPSVCIASAHMSIDKTAIELTSALKRSQGPPQVPLRGDNSSQSFVKRGVLRVAFESLPAHPLGKGHGRLI